MIRALIVDDHPAVRSGVKAVLGTTPDMIAVATAAGDDELWRAMRHGRPDVVIMDYHLPGSDGLILCHRLKHSPVPPAVLLYTAYARRALIVPAAVAGADGIVAKSAPARDLLDAIRAVARGESVMPALDSDLVSEAAAALADEDRPALAMLLDGASMGEVADALRAPVDEVAQRVRRIIAALRLEVPARDEL